LNVTKDKGDNIIDLAGVEKQQYSTVIVMDIQGKPIVYTEPEIKAASSMFIDKLAISFPNPYFDAAVHYTLDGSEPVAGSPAARSITINKSATIKAKTFFHGKPITPTSTATFEKVTPKPAQKISSATPGLQYAQYEGNWSKVPDFAGLT